jgi:hypothetical protein
MVSWVKVSTESWLDMTCSYITYMVDGGGIWF